MLFPFDAHQRPTLPVRLSVGDAFIERPALLDTGADVNVLPWSLGVALGLEWREEKATLRIKGVPSVAAAMPVLIRLTAGTHQPVTQAFAWCSSDAIPLVLGQTNFFMEFDVCFLRSRLEFSVVAKAR